MIKKKQPNTSCGNAQWAAAFDSKPKTHLSQVILDSPARARIPTEWEDWPAPLRAFGIIGLENEIVEDMKTLPTAKAKGPCSLSLIDYVQLLSWRMFNVSPTRRRTKKPPDG